VTSTFPAFKLDNMDLKFVTSFKYLGHIITNDEYDNKDTSREVRAICLRTQTFWPVGSVYLLLLLK